MNEDSQLPTLPIIKDPQAHKLFPLHALLVVDRMEHISDIVLFAKTGYHKEILSINTAQICVRPSWTVCIYL